MPFFQNLSKFPENRLHRAVEFLTNLQKDGPSEHKKCLCKHKECAWAQKSQKCPITTNDNDSGTTSGGHHSGSTSDLSNLSGLNGLRSIMRELSLTNNGNINVNFNLR